MKKPHITIIKVGGAVVENNDSLQQLLQQFAQISGARLFVHGGGRTATAMASQLGMESHMVNGRRVTDADMLKVVTMVYGGLVNKHIVAMLQAMGLPAIGLTGADADLIRAHRRPITHGVDYGFVGDVDRVNSYALHRLLQQGLVPVMAPLTHDGNGTMLNTNADTIASSLAVALTNFYDVELVYCFEKKGVLSRADDDNSVIPVITPDSFVQLQTDGVVAGGMIPKLQNAVNAVKQGVPQVRITSAKELLEQGTIIREKA